MIIIRKKYRLLRKKFLSPRNSGKTFSVASFHFIFGHGVCAMFLQLSGNGRWVASTMNVGHTRAI